MFHVRLFMVNVIFVFPPSCDMTDETVSMDFGRTLQQARMAKEMTQKELATVSVWLSVLFTAVWLYVHVPVYACTCVYRTV